MPELAQRPRRLARSPVKHRVLLLGNGFHAEQLADGRGGAAADVHAGSAEGAEELLAGGVLAELDAESAKPFAERRDGVVTDSCDLSAAEIDNRERLEDVVKLTSGEVDVDFLVAADMSGVLEVSDAVLVEDDAGNRQVVGP